MTVNNSEQQRIKVSPKYILDPNTGKIFSVDNPNKELFNCENENGSRLIFEDRMQGWFFDPSLKLVNETNSSVVAIHIVTPLIEALRYYTLGRKPEREREESSGDFFKEQAKNIFPLLKTNESALKLLYKGVRCGFAHQGFPKDDNDAYNVLISPSNETAEPIEFNNPVMTIYARQYVEKVNSAYKNYFQELDNDSDKLHLFFKMWKHQWKMKVIRPIEISGA